MFINEFGGRDNPTIILLAPMMVSGSTHESDGGKATEESVRKGI